MATSNRPARKAGNLWRSQYTNNAHHPERALAAYRQFGQTLQGFAYQQPLAILRGDLGRRVHRRLRWRRDLPGP
jgi:hypothetical protein